MAGKTIVVLGGGTGGVVAANELRRRLDREHQVVLVDREGSHVFWPSLLWLQVGLRKPDSIVRDLAGLERKGIQVIKEPVEAIDPARKTVRLPSGEIEADQMVISLGADLAPEKVPGLAEAGHNLYTLAGATAVRDTRFQLTSGSLAVVVASTPFKCPAAPYEAAMLLENDLRKRNVRDRVSVSLFTPEAGPMGVAGPVVSAGVRDMLEERNIDYYPQHQIGHVDPNSRTLHFKDQNSASFDYLVFIPPHQAPAVVSAAGLTGDSGWIPVDRQSMETRFPGVYAIGDVTSIPLAMGLPLPKAGVFAHHQAQVVAATIAATITGTGSSSAFNGHGVCFVEVGGGKAGFGRGDFYAEPVPKFKMYKPGRHWHAAKVLFEKDWFRRWL